MLKIFTFAVMALFVLCGRLRCDEEIKRPHIIFILGKKIRLINLLFTFFHFKFIVYLADDMGWNDVSFHGSR